MALSTIGTNSIADDAVTIAKATGFGKIGQVLQAEHSSAVTLNTSDLFNSNTSPIAAVVELKTCDSPRSTFLVLNVKAFRLEYETEWFPELTPEESPPRVSCTLSSSVPEPSVVIVTPVTGMTI